MADPGRTSRPALPRAPWARFALGLVTLAATVAPHLLSPAQAANPGPLPSLPDPGPDTLTTFSQSGQFVVAGPKPGRARPMESRAVGVTRRELTPQTLAVSCERVKDEILRILELTDQWRAADGGRAGRILVQIDPHFPTNTPPTVQATPFEQGWHLRVPLPRTLEQELLVRTITHAVLLELASRRSNARVAEIPLWLVEGLTQTILANVPEGIILQPETRLVADLRVAERLASLRDLLARRGALEFHQLSQPDLSRMSHPDWERYSACSHLLVHELMRLPDGGAHLKRWILHLQDHWNWQTGLVESFQPGFRSLLDVEKWWALTIANFTGRTPAQAWPAPFALRKLDEALQPVGILPGVGNQAGRLRVEAVIADWDYARQVPVLREVLRQLNFIRLNAPAEVSPLVHRYLDLLEQYLDTRARAGFSPTSRSQPMPSVKLLARDTVARFRSLQEERLALGQRVIQDASPADPISGGSLDTQPTR
ncbi:MAG: hypothetical protein IT580_19305 [Verrucomicrobiales bacterium]|nr:hypothetical protein [Verrucomicrobiales bacterium]